jgi:hypothetical protein
LWIVRDWKWGLTFQKSFNNLIVNSGALFTYELTKLLIWLKQPQAFPYLSRIGHPVDQPFGWEAIGFFKDEADIASSSLCRTFDRVSRGVISNIKTRTMTGRINENDVVAMGFHRVSAD